SCGAAAYLRQPVFISDMLSHPNWEGFRDVVLQSGLRAAWSTPILSHDGKVLGTFCMYYREVRQPVTDEIQLIDYASRIAAIAIERKRAEEKLRQDERDLRRITDAIPHTIVIQDPDGIPVYANQAVLDYTGLTMEDVITSDFRARIFHPEDLERLREPNGLSGCTSARSDQPGLERRRGRRHVPSGFILPAQCFSDPNTGIARAR